MNRYLFILFFLMVVFNDATTQEKEAMPAKRQTSGRYQYLDSAKRFENTNPSKSFDYIEKSLTQSIEYRDKKGEALSYQALGRINYGLNQIDLAIDYYYKAASLLESVNDEYNLNRTYELLAEAYHKAQDYENSLNFYGKYLQYAEKNGSANEVLRTKNNIAQVYAESGKPAKALSLLNEVLQVEKERNNPAGIISTQNRIGNIYQETRNEDKALKAYGKSEELAESINDQDALAKSLKNKSSALRQSKRYDEELEVRKKLLTINSGEGQKPEQAEENLEIGNILVEQNEAGKAIPYIKRSIELADETGNLEKKGKALQTLSAAYGQQQNYNKALETYKTYVETMDALYKKRESDIMAGMQITATLNRKLERLDMIEQDLRLSRKTVELLKQEQLVNQRELKAQQVLTYSLSGALLVLAIASFFVYRSGNQKRKANQLLALKSLRSQMNPHFIYNSLNSVNNFISRSDEKAANKYLSEFSRLMRSVMDNSKHDFIPLNSEIETLKLYLSLEYERFKDKFEYRFEVDPEIHTESCFVPPMLIQPFIENAIWHGLRYRNSKGLLTVNIQKNKKNIHIIIEDNGIGRKKSRDVKTKFQKQHVSTGMLNIESRIGIINQLFRTGITVSVKDLDEGTSEGTKVTISIPGDLMNRDYQNKTPGRIAESEH